MLELKTMNHIRWSALKAAFPYTIPILTGFLFLGMTYGLYMHAAGFPFWYPLIMALTIFGGSLEFVAVAMLLSPFAPLQVFLVALMIQSRHLFYGISMHEKYKGLGWKRWYCIFGLCDETFSINYTVQIPKHIDRGWFMLWVTALNQVYWVTGATIGALIGNLLTFNLQGLDFVMTAMFVVIFIEQWKKESSHYSAYIGLFASVICLKFFGPDGFIVPTLLAILLLLLAFRRPIERAEVQK